MVDEVVYLYVSALTSFIIKGMPVKVRYLYSAAELNWLTSSNSTAESVSFTLVAWHQESTAGKAARVVLFLFLSKTRSSGKWHSDSYLHYLIYYYYYYLIITWWPGRALLEINSLGQTAGWMALHKEEVESCQEKTLWIASCCFWEEHCSVCWVLLLQWCEMKESQGPPCIEKKVQKHCVP